MSTKKQAGSPEGEKTIDVTTKAELKEFLLNVRDKMTDDIAAPVYALSAMNSIMTLPTIYTLLDKRNKEIARDIWLRIKQAGIQIKDPPLLFSADERAGASGALNK